MSDRQRRQAFALCATVAMVAWAVLTLLGPGSGGGEGAASAGRPLVVAAAPDRAAVVRPDAAGVADPMSGRGEREAILATSRRFAASFLRYEVGQAPPPVRRTLERTATADLAARLLVQPPAKPPGAPWPAKAWVESVVSIRIDAGGTAVATFGLRRGPARSTATLLLRRLGAGWRVSGLQ